MLGGEGSGRGGGGEGAGAMKKGPWTAAEDAILMEYVKKNGEGNWNAVQRNSGLLRCGKSCRLRWANHLRPNLKKGSFTPEEERLILELHAKLGNKWARMATQLPGRTDNEIKNYWNTRIKRRHRAGLPLYPPDIHHQNNFFQQHHHQSRQGLQTDNKTQFPGNPAPLSLLDPIPIGFSSSSTMAASPSSLMGHSLFGSGGNPQPFLAHSTAGPQQQFKRPREEGLGLPTMFFGGQAAPVVRFSSRNNVVGLQQQQQYSPFSVKMELPSSQFAPAPPGDGQDPWGRNNSGLLDALLEDAQGGGAAATNRRIAVCDPSMEMLLPKSTAQEEANRKGPAEDVRLSNGKSNGNGGSFGLPPENKMKNEQVENVASENEDLSALFDFMPPSQISMEATPRATNWFKNDSGEMSNGQSSGVTEDDIGLEMQQLASSLSMAAEDHTWNIGSDHWDNMPGIC